MKKSVLFLLAVFVIGFIAIAQDDAPEEITADALTGTPTIDASIEDCWGAGTASLGNNGGTTDGDADISYTMYMNWDNDGLYVAVDVKDDFYDWAEDDLNEAGDGTNGNIWEYDNVEIFINPTGERNPDDVTLAGTNSSQIRYCPLDGELAVNNSGEGYATDKYDQLNWMAEEVSGGYVFETFIPWAAIIPEEITVPPAKIGFTVNVGDSDEAGAHRECIALWCGAGLGDEQWHNTSYYGLLNMSADIGCAEGIDENLAPSLNLYPNPATNMVTVENATEDIVVYNSIGQVVLTVTASSSTVNVDVSSLAAGIYVFQSGSSMNKVLVK